MKQKPKPFVKKPVPAPKPAAKAAAPTILWMDKLEALKGKAVWISMAAVALVALFVYWDYITLEKVLLYKDIGSDSINIFYPQWMQMAKHWAEYGSNIAYSLQIAMGQSISFNQIDLFYLMTIGAGPENVPMMVGFVEVFKVLLTGVLAYQYFKLLGLKSASSLLGALCFSFGGYLSLGASGWYNFSMEALIVVFSLWSVEYFINKRKWYYLLFPVFAWIIVNLSSYILIYLFAGLTLYVFIRKYEQGRLLEAIKNLGLFLGLFGVAFMLSFQKILGLIDLLTKSGRSESIEVAGGAVASKMDGAMFSLAESTEYTSVVLRAFSTNLLGVGNDFKGWMNFLEAPLLYMGLAMLFFIPFYFVGNERMKRILYGALVGAAVLVLVFPWFRYAFWGFKLDYFREFTMLIGAFLLTIAIRGFDRFITLEHKHTKWYALGTTALLLILLFRFSGDGALVDETRRAIITFFVVLMGALTFLYSIMRKPVLILMLIALSALELGYNANATINDRDVLTTREMKAGKLYGDATLKALDWINAQDSSLFRVSKSYPSGPSMHSSLNDAMVQGFNGLVGYSSFHNKYYLRFMGETGAIDRSDQNTAKWVVGIINRQYLSAFLGAKYFLFKGQPFGGDPVSFPMVKQVEDVFIHQTPLAMPLLVAYDSYITEDDYRALDNGSKDLTIYRALIANLENADQLKGLRQWTTQDSLPPLTIEEFAKAATERRAMMDVDAHTRKDGITATVNLKKTGIVVVQLPYDESMMVRVDGQVQESFVGNFGFFAFPLSAGKHEIEVVLGE